MRISIFQRKLIPEAAAIHHLSPDAATARALQNIGIGMVGKDDDNLGIQAAIIYRVENRLAIAARTRTEYCKTKTHNRANLPDRHSFVKSILYAAAAKRAAVHLRTCLKLDSSG